MSIFHGAPQGKGSVMEEKYVQAAIEYIEGMVGCYGAVWREWPTKDIRDLYIYVCKSDHGEITIEDAERVGITLR